jgi:hypothetical protein
MKVKALVAGLLFAVAGTSQAALIADGVTTVHGGTPAGAGATADVTHGGDLFLVVLNEVSGSTYYQNLDTDFVAFKNTLSSTNRSFGIDALGQTFLSSAADTYKWAVFAGDSLRGVVGGNRGAPVTNYGTVADWGVLTTGGSTGTAGGFTVDQQTLDDAVTAKLAQGIDNNVNGSLGSTNSAIFLKGDAADYAPKNNNLANSALFNGNGPNGAFSAAGSDVNTFWYLGFDGLHAGVGAKTVHLGDFVLTGSSLNFTTATVSNVPVPAAVWLLGSALAGFATVARREKKS